MFGTSDRGRGIWKYLNTVEEERHKYNRSKYNKAAREYAKEAIDYLTLFLQKQEEKEISKVFLDEIIFSLIQALVGFKRKEIQTLQSLPTFYYKFAKACLILGTKRLFDKVSPYYRDLIRKNLDDVMTVFMNLPLEELSLQAQLAFEKELKKQIRLEEEVRKQSRPLIS